MTCKEFEELEKTLYGHIEKVGQIEMALNDHPAFVSSEMLVVLQEVSVLFYSSYALQVSAIYSFRTF